MYLPRKTAIAAALKPTAPIKNINHVLSKGEKCSDSLRLKILNTAAHKTAAAKRSIPVVRFSLPSFEIMLMTETLTSDTAVQTPCNKVGFSPENSTDKSITATGTSAIITPDNADETRLKP